MTESQDERAPSRAERTTSRVYGWDEVLFLKPTAEQQREEGKEILGKISWGMQGLCFLLRQANYMCGVSDSRANTARPDVRGGDQMWQSQTDRSTNCDKKCEWRKSKSKRPEVFFFIWRGKNGASFSYYYSFKLMDVLLLPREKSNDTSPGPVSTTTTSSEIKYTARQIALAFLLFYLTPKKRRNNDD